MVRDMTSGRPLRLILAFAIPLLLGNLIQQIYNTVDSAIVGQFIGKEALAAVGSTGSIFNLVIGFTGGVAAGFGIILASYFGAGDHDRLRNCVANIIYLAAGITVVLTVLAVSLARPMLLWMDTPPDILEDAYRYIVIIYAGIFSAMLYNVLAYILRALGDSRSPLFFLIISACVNVGADLLFVLVFHMGTAGVALATVLAQTLSAVACFFYIRIKMPILRLTKKDFAECGATLADTENLVNYGIETQGIRLAMMAIERDAGTRFSLRGKGEVDVSRIAQRFGGGGHPCAAGATVNLPMDEAIEAVLRAATDERED